MKAGTLHAARALRRQGMPISEIGVVLACDDPVLVRRYLELHGERLEERLAEERRELASIERSVGARDRRAAGRPQAFIS